MSAGVWSGWIALQPDDRRSTVRNRRCAHHPACGRPGCSLAARGGPGASQGHRPALAQASRLPCEPAGAPARSSHPSHTRSFRNALQPHPPGSDPELRTSSTVAPDERSLPAHASWRTARDRDGPRAGAARRTALRRRAGPRRAPSRGRGDLETLLDEPLTPLFCNETTGPTGTRAARRCRGDGANGRRARPATGPSGSTTCGTPAPPWRRRGDRRRIHP